MYLNNEKIYALMNQFKILVRNYNIEVDVTINHLKDENVGRSTVYHDFQTLMFKPLFLISKMIDIEARIDETDNKYAFQDREYLVHRAAAIILESHIASVIDKQDAVKIDWGKYVYNKYAIDQQYDSARAFNILFKGCDKMAKVDLLDCYEWENEDKLAKYLSEDISLSNLWNVTADSPLHQIISADKFDLKTLFSIILSVDSSLEKSLLNFIAVDA